MNEESRPTPDAVRLQVISELIEQARKNRDGEQLDMLELILAETVGGTEFIISPQTQEGHERVSAVIDAEVKKRKQGI